MLYLNGLRALEAVARTGSFNGAAQELRVTPGAVSQKVRQLEAYLGMALIARSGRKAEPTTLARQILPDLHSGIASLEKAWATLQLEGRQERITLTLPPSVAAQWLVPRLDAVRIRFPHISIHMITTDELLDLERSNVDFAIRYGPAAHAETGALLLSREVLVPVCAPQLVNGEHPLRTPLDLRNHRLIHDRTLSAFDEVPTWDDWLALTNAPPRETLTDLSVDASALAIQAAIGGLGVALMRSLLVQDDLAAGRLVVPFAPVVPSPFSYYLLRRERRVLRGPPRKFQEWLIEEFRAASEAPTPAFSLGAPQREGSLPDALET